MSSAEPTNRAEKAALQLQAVRVLRMLKATRTYDELAAETGLPAGDLNRYVNGHVLPGPERARAVVADVGPDALAAAVRERIRVDDAGFVDNSRVVFDQPFLDLVAPAARGVVGFERPDVVLTAATDGITLAAAMASALDARVAYAKESKETAVDAFVEASGHLGDGMRRTYYLPASAVGDGDRVLVVDDLIRSGDTQQLLLDLVASAGGDVCGVFALIAVGEEGIDRARARTNAPVGALTTLEE